MCIKQIKTSKKKTERVCKCLNSLVNLIIVVDSEKKINNGFLVELICENQYANQFMYFLRSEILST